MSSRDYGYEKISKWCAYRERCFSEVIEKCLKSGIDKIRAEEIANKLVADGYVDDRRFARMYAHARSSLKKWGKKKIEIELKRRAIHTDYIKEAIESIEHENYRHVLYHLATKKWDNIKAAHPYEKKNKLRMFLFQKGYSHDDISEVIRQIENEDK